MRMLKKEAKFSALWFLLPIMVIAMVLVDNLLNFKFNLKLNIEQHFWWFLAFYFIFLTVYLRFKYTDFFYEIGIRSVFLGAVFSAGLFIVMYSSFEWRLFGLYICLMSFFHYSEFFTIAWCNPKTLSIGSFLLNHSVQYNIAVIASWIEFTLEIYFTPGIKRFPKISFLGFILCVLGEVLRKVAMITGSTNFSHIVQTKKVDDHELVTHGIYSIFRHPSYVGWFYWSIGTQLLLLNPFCSIAYTIVSWRFFRERIVHEEHTLLCFFGRDYIDYQKIVGTGLPGIKGFSFED